MKSFIEQVEELNRKYGKVLTVRELEECKKRGELKVEKAGAIDEYAYVHVTDWEPREDEIETVKSKVDKEKRIYKLGETRDSTHFSVNGNVESHGNRRLAEKKVCNYLSSRNIY